MVNTKVILSVVGLLVLAGIFINAVLPDSESKSYLPVVLKVPYGGNRTIYLTAIEEDRSPLEKEWVYAVDVYDDTWAFWSDQAHGCMTDNYGKCTIEIDGDVFNGLRTSWVFLSSPNIEKWQDVISGDTLLLDGGIGEYYITIGFKTGNINGKYDEKMGSPVTGSIVMLDKDQ